jgi:hypothetical protein
MLGRYSSAIRAACANERSCGSVRAAISDDRPYRDLIDRVLSEIALERTQTTAGVFRSQLEVFSRGLLDRFPERQLS